MGLLDSVGTQAVTLLVLILFAFLPPILFLIWTRNTERYGREPWPVVAKVFVWGAVFAVIIAVVLSMAFITLYRFAAPVYAVLGDQPTVETLVLALVIAPFVEEAAKAFGIYGASHSINEVEDGLVYGAASGFGFSATENLVYGLAVLIAMGPGVSITLIVLRSVSSTLLHASATSVTGLGIGKRLAAGGKSRVAPYYLVAVAIHSLFNFFASIGGLYVTQLGETAAYIGFASAWVFAILAFSVIRSRILKGEDASMSRLRRPPHPQG